MRVDIQPVETTLYSLSDAPPEPAASPERRDGERLMTLYRVGSIQIEDRRELCLIKNISAGGMMIRLYCAVSQGTPVVVELKSGQPISGRISWTREDQAGIAFDRPIDVIDVLSSSMGGARPRMPRIEINCIVTIREGANLLRAEGCDISQGGLKVRGGAGLAPASEVIITLPGLEAQPGIACWNDGDFTGLAFNKLLPLGELVAWLHEQRELQRASS